ncbi:PilZ domain-containing protein [Novosphingobium bradum]|uniref:PilZ domain-containing protein n=1 Tax=Novosphingobium bradum TaxID=1737444 RepID=A0ABV7ISY8_9SPHN
MTLVDKSLFTATPVFRARRRKLTVRVQVAGGTGAALDAIARDVSPQGMSAIAQGSPPPAGEVITVALPDGSSLWGVVRWAEGKAFGVEFDPGSHEAPAAGLLAP